jgi:hypothetical protein
MEAAPTPGETTIAVEPEKDYGIEILTRKEGVLLVRLRVTRIARPH